jgi:hypothetical protein
MVYQSTPMWLTLHREQARSYRDFGKLRKCGLTGEDR